MNSANEQLADIQKVLETSKNVLQTTDHSEKARTLLSEKALAALSKKATSQIIQIAGTMDGYTCIYLAVNTRKENVADGVSVICKALNILAENDLIHSCLAPIGSLDLAKMPLRAAASTVYCFVLVPMKRKEEAEKLAACCVEEGELPGGAGDCEADLAEDEFFAEISLSHYLTINGTKSLEERLHSCIGEFINVLPAGTEVLEVVPCAIIGLSLPYEIRFRNPLMKEYREVRLIYRRECVRIGEDEIQQFNLLTAVEYVRKDGK